MISAELEQRLRSAFPEASFDRRFVEHFEQLDLPDTFVTDLYLAWACAAHHPWALIRFERELLPKAITAARGVDKDGALRDDVGSQLRARLLVGLDDRPPRILEYAGTGPLENWIRSVAIRTTLNLLPRRPAEEPIEAAVKLAGPDPELEFLKTTYRAEFKRAFQTALEQLPPEELTLLRLHVVDQLSIDRICAMYQTHRATAARRLTRARERLCDLTRDQLAEQLGLAGDELESVMQLVRSNVDVSLVRLLRR